MLGKIKNFFRTLPSRITPVKLFVSLMAFSATVYVIIYAIIGNGFFTDLFFRNSIDFFMDFFNSIRDASNIDAVYSEHGVIYPPMANLIFLVLSRFTPNLYNSTEFDDRYDWVKYSAPFMLLVITVAVFAILLYSLVKSSLNEKNKRLASLFAAFAFFNAPVLYMVERGNILMFCLVSLMVFAFSYNSESKVSRELGLIALAFAFSLKLYPVIFGWFLIRDKRFKEALRCAIYGILMIVLPSFAFGGFKVFKMIAQNIFSFSSSDNTGNIFSRLLGFFGLDHINADFMTPVMWGWAALVCVCFILAPFVMKKNWKAYAVGVLAIVCIPSLTALYAWAFMLVPMIFFCNEKEKTRADWFYFVTMLIPFIFIPFRVHYAITNNGLALYFCAYVLSGVAIFDTVKALVLLIKENRKAGITFGQYFKSLVKVEK